MTEIMPQKMVELLPCPFCGGDAKQAGDLVDGFYVYCINCECGTPEFHTGISHDAKQAAISRSILLWNTRASLTEKALPDGWAYLGVSLHTRPGMKWPECAFTVRISNGLDKTVSGDGLTFYEAERAAIAAVQKVTL